MRKAQKVQLLILYHDSFYIQSITRKYFWVFFGSKQKDILYNGRIKESPVHFWSMFSMDRSALHCQGLLRHLSSWLRGSKKGQRHPHDCDNWKQNPVFPNTSWKRSLPFSRTALSERAYLLRNNLVILISKRMPSCLCESSRMRYVRSSGRKEEQERNIQYSLNPSLINPSIKIPELTIQGSSQKLQLHPCG